VLSLLPTANYSPKENFDQYPALLKWS
jgi:hypothetical protein